MKRRCRRVWSWLLCIAPFPVAGFSSTTTYHLHKVSTTSLLQLKTNAREPVITVLQSADFIKQPVGDYLVEGFDTAAGIPSVAGTILPTAPSASVYG